MAAASESEGLVKASYENGRSENFLYETFQWLANNKQADFEKIS